MSECAICWNKKRLTTLSPCGHKFCSECLIKQFRFQHKCAMCRSIILSCSPPLIKLPQDEKLIINKEKNVSIGFSYHIVNDKLILLSVEKNSIAYDNGLCRSDIISSINGIHIFSLAWLQEVISESETIVLTVIQSDPKIPQNLGKIKCFCCFAKILPK